MIAGLQVLEGTNIDPVKLTVNLASTGVDGMELERALVGQGMPVEYADRDILVAMVTIADTAETVHAFVHALKGRIEILRGEPRTMTASFVWTITPEQALSPRAAFFAPHEFIPINQAVGRICAELIAPYPPGIPALAPGEVISADVIDGLRDAHASGTRIAYAADPSLSHIRVVK
jgi:lysine decarboxylase